MSLYETNEYESGANVHAEPIAVVGYAYRLPGLGVGVGDGALIERLGDGHDCFGAVPAGRFLAHARTEAPPDASAIAAMAHGAFLPAIDAFDPAFFGISPREAACMDPHQRMSLMVAWEALERAGLVPDALRERRVGIYVGASSDDFRRAQASAASPLGPYSGTGTAPSVVSGRIAYVLGTRGPTMTIDTACSSSLVAAHLGIRALRANEAELALVGGVNLMLSPEPAAYFASIRAISPKGRCRPFDDAADGYVRGEGCVFFVLAPLSVARRRGLRVRALLRGSAVNHDGRSAGLTAPSGPAQELVVRAAIADARLSPSDIDYVEAHGTGTPLGDPIEVGALGRVFSARAPADPVWIGSAKGQFGHLEAAAGLTGLLRVVASLESERLPGQVGFEVPSSKLAWDELPVAVVTETRPWTRSGERVRRAGVSSFGLSGTNAHVVVEEAPAASAAPARAEAREGHEPLVPLLLSARAPEVLPEVARSYSELLGTSGSSVRDVCAAAALRRTHHPHRVALTGPDRDALLRDLAALSEGGTIADGSVGRARPSRPVRPVFVFSGQGTQWVGMGRALAGSSAVFREELEKCRRALRRHSSLDAVGSLLGVTADAPLERISEIQPAIFALQVALAAELRRVGIEPAAVVGHSMGEVAAAHVAGALSLDDAARVIAVRSALVECTRGQGTMAAVELEASEVAERLARRRGTIEIAAINATSMVLVAGPAREVVDFVSELEGEGVFARRLAVDYASHCAMMDALLGPLTEALRAIAPSEPRIPMRSTVTVRAVTEGELDAAYWAANLRMPVRFAEAVATLVDEGFDTYLELSPHPSVIQGVDSMLRERGVEGHAGGTLRRGMDEASELRRVHAALWARGVPVRFDAFHPDGVDVLVDLPTYPFKRDVFPLPEPVGAGAEKARGAETHACVAGRRSMRVSCEALEGHAVAGRAIAPATTFLELALCTHGGPARALRDVRFRAPLDLDGVDPEIFLDESDGRVTFRGGAGGDLVLMEAASDARSTPPETSAQRGAFPSFDDGAAAARELYAKLARAGLSYGPRFSAVDSVARAGDVVAARIDLARACPAEAHGTARWLDACLHAACSFVPESNEVPFVPAAIERVELWRAPLDGSVVCRIERSARAADDPASLSVDVLVLGAEDGAPIARFDALLLRPLAEGRRRTAGQDYVVRFVPAPVTEAGGAVPPAGRIVRADRMAPSEPSDPAGFVTELCERVLDELRAAVADATRGPVWVVTAGAQETSAPAPTTIAQAAVWGLVRSVALEHPELRCTLLDLELADLESAEERVAAALMSGTPGEQHRYRDGRLEAARLVPLPFESPPFTPAPEGPWALRIARPGVLDELTIAGTTRRAPGRGEVEVEVEAAGLNFRDVLMALGAVPDGSRLAGEEPRLGCELAGTAVRVGAGVDPGLLGRRIAGIAFGAIASHAITDARLVVPIPAGMDVAVAAGQLVAHVTVRHAIDDVARVAPNEWVLIHSAAGAVGLAALDRCRRLGARVIATAGTAEKRALLLERGADVVSDSRSLDFVRAVREATGGRGVDVVLNSLAGEATAQSLGLLRDFGRFVELGKRDAYGDERLALRPFLRNLSFALVDLVELCRQRPDEVARLLRAVIVDLEADATCVLPTEVAPIEAAAAVFHRMAQGKHVGKQVLRTCPPPASRVVMRTPVVDVRSDATYVVTGGLGGLGRAVASWLASRGARNLVLLGRSAPSEAAARGIDELRAGGVRVRLEAVDAADRRRLAASLARIEQELPPIRGIVHAAGVLEDRVALDVDAGTLRRVMAPKIVAAQLLHELTRGAELDFFVLFSSLAGVVGSHGQSAYAAANAALDALAAYRRALGLPALSIAWGPFAEVGLAAADARRGARLETLGVRSLFAPLALDAFRRLDSTCPPSVAIFEADFARWCAEVGHVPALLADLVGANGSADGLTAARHDDAVSTLRASLSGLTRSEVRARLLEHLLEALAVTLRTTARAIDPAMPLSALGLDSMMALELRNRLSRSLGVALAATAVWRFPTSERLADHLVDLLGFASEDAAPEPRVDVAHPTGTSQTGGADGAQELEDLSSEELATLLSDELRSLDGV